jgi:hypothetical protein
MTDKEQPTMIAASGPAYVCTITGQPPATDERPENVTAASAVHGFESVKHLLSDKPLRRPNRTRPLET